MVSRYGVRQSTKRSLMSSCHHSLKEKELTMRKVLVTFVAIVALFVFASSPLAATEITVSPNVINIASASTVVTVHTDVPYSLVAGASVTLNGLEISWWKSDDRGYFVAKFSSEEVKVLDDVVDAGEQGIPVELTLTGVTVDGMEFGGTDTVKVINIKSKKK